MELVPYKKHMKVPSAAPGYINGHTAPQLVVGYANNIWFGLLSPLDILTVNFALYNFFRKVCPTHHIFVI